MKILFINDYFPPIAPGGAEWSSFYQAKALLKKGHQILILTPDYGCRLKPKLKGKLRLLYLSFPFKLKPGTKTLPFLVNNNIFYYLYFAFIILKTCAKEKVDLIHIQSRFTLPALLIIKLFLRQPVFYTVRDTVLVCPTGICLQKSKYSKNKASFSYFWQHCRPDYINFYIKPKNLLSLLYTQLSLLYFWLDTLIKRQALKLADKNLFISRALLQLYCQVGLVDKTKAEVVYNLPPLKKPQVKTKTLSLFKKQYQLYDKKIVVFAGRLTPGKGVAILLQAAELVFSKEPKVKFLLIGKGKLSSSKSYIQIVPAVDQKKLFHFYKLADLITVPSLSFEPLGRIPQEAACFEKPVVVSQSGGLIEQIKDGQTGFIVPRQNHRDLALKILKILKNKQLRLKLGKNHKHYIFTKFNPSKIINQLEKIYLKQLKS